MKIKNKSYFFQQLQHRLNFLSLNNQIWHFKIWLFKLRKWLKCVELVEIFVFCLFKNIFLI